MSLQQQVAYVWASEHWQGSHALIHIQIRDKSIKVRFDNLVIQYMWVWAVWKSNIKTPLCNMEKCTREQPTFINIKKTLRKQVSCYKSVAASWYLKGVNVCVTLPRYSQRWKSWSRDLAAEKGFNKPPQWPMWTSANNPTGASRNAMAQCELFKKVYKEFQINCMTMFSVLGGT